MSDFNEGSLKGSNTALKTVLGVCACLLLIGLLIAVLFPREGMPERRIQCINNMKQIVLALHLYYAQHELFLPAYATDEDGKPLHSWRVLILPYLEQKELYDQIRLDEPWDSEYNKQFHDQMPMIYLCPSSQSSPRNGFTSYQMVVGPNTISDGSSAKSFNDVTA
ncbi:MAG: DUF1559 domain-containing protein, partial [Planctomycetaceae bacterium]|nr:DUF1559 domain-containing protein [Planctomycetaceae bacterium]